MEAALKAVTLGESIRKSADRFDIRFRNVFNEDEEKVIEEHVILLSKLYFGLTLIELRRLAFEFAETNNIKNNFCRDTRLARKDWLYGFLKRHPKISLRKPEASANRVMAFNKEEVQHFYSNLEQVVSKYKISAIRLYNVDETGITTAQTPSRALGLKRVKQLGASTNWKRGKNVTEKNVTSAMERWTTWSNISLLQKWMDDHQTVYSVAKTFCHSRERICGEPRATCDGQSFQSQFSPIISEPTIQISVASNDEHAATSANLTSPIPATPPHTSDTNPSKHPTTNIASLVIAKMVTFLTTNPITTFSSAVVETNTTKEVCPVCNGFGRDNELWFRCVLCSGWTHTDCSGQDTSNNSMCDFCLN
ncbi:hypothetical protein ILUMI_25876 [Ignelater luminosus]|uniref:HTH CENPB-type domain-containing protein n=1 Tax=Ignelater luminosus TaxID=2038154 RepID=A0A8K0C4Z0_IGNLU|nr:hypothetical protein ILUMI_25876 [Ignelater luminosus]